jgi:hypothetical protein
VGDALKVVAVLYWLLNCVCPKRYRNAAIQRIAREDLRMVDVVPEDSQ